MESDRTSLISSYHKGYAGDPLEESFNGQGITRKNEDKNWTEGYRKHHGQDL